MSGPLPKEPRNQLARTIVAARRQAEAGARKALESLSVERHEPFSSMSTEERALRNRLRARGRQLGDVRDSVRGGQSIDHLTHEVAYEHWHRMLFARFLAENELLLEPTKGVPISLEECADLARETGEDPHSMAARFAQESLPQIFRMGDPVLDVTLAPETRQALRRLLDGLPRTVFMADDSLGWTYQYWQSEKKNEVNASGVKIGADELPAVTQLFTEHYMVLFLFHNTIGAWHAGKFLSENPRLGETARSEEELRQAVRLTAQEGYDFEYLRFVREKLEGDEDEGPSGPWRPATGVFEGWPRTAAKLKILDPCCGSGHFLVEGFALLVRLRMHEEGLGTEAAIRAVLAENLHGLELDARCTQIAAFNLALAAWKLAGEPFDLPPMHIACCGLSVGSTKQVWTELAGDDGRLRAGMEALYDLFEKARELGSLIDPRVLRGTLLEADFAELQPFLKQALEREREDVERAERAVAARGMARAAELLAGEYTLAITNVPYLGRGQHSELLRAFAEEHYSDAKADLATIFLERLLRCLGCTGTAAMVTPQNWLFLSRYRKLREKLLKRRTWNLVARLGPGAFETISGEVVNVALPMITVSKPTENHLFASLDVSQARTPLDKARLLRDGAAGRLEDGGIACAVRSVPQRIQLLNPDFRITERQNQSSAPLLSERADAYQGLVTGDRSSFIFSFWEMKWSGYGWEPFVDGFSGEGLPLGREKVILWERGLGRLHRLAGVNRKRLHDMHESGNRSWGKAGVLLTRIGLRATPYWGEMYDNNLIGITPRDPSELLALWNFCRSETYRQAVHEIDQKFSLTNATACKVRVELSEWSEKGEFLERQSDDPTQWLFHGHPAKAEPATVLQVAVGRLLGYRWPSELDPKMLLADEAREWVAHCGALKDYADEDGIVCLSATRGERSAADRLRGLLSAAFGSDWSAAKERDLLAVAGDGKKPAASLETWLLDRFFEEHCKLFHHRPFVWHIWDGNRDGFHCLVNAHKLIGPEGEGRRTLEAVTYSYLGDWIDRQKADQKEGKEGADGRLAAAQDLQDQLEKILEGEPPFDLFVRWKAMHEQALGWEPDINDGVRLNIRPLMKAELRNGGKKGAGILRWKPNIKWDKDRGKEPESLRPRSDFPWFWNCPGDGMVEDITDFSGAGEFDGKRWNDLHLTNEFKQVARAKAKGKVQG